MSPGKKNIVLVIYNSSDFIYLSNSVFSYIFHTSDIALYPDNKFQIFWWYDNIKSTLLSHFAHLGARWVCLRGSPLVTAGSCSAHEADTGPTLSNIVRLSIRQKCCIIITDRLQCDPWAFCIRFQLTSYTIIWSISLVIISFCTCFSST